MVVYFLCLPLLTGVSALFGETMNAENGVAICSVGVSITVAMCALTLLVDQHEEQLICKPAPFVTNFFWHKRFGMLCYHCLYGFSVIL